MIEFMMYLEFIKQNKNIRNFLLNDFISWFGSGIPFIGINWYIFEITGSTFQVGIIIVISVLSGLLLTPLFGAVADHCNRKTALFWTNLARGLGCFLFIIPLYLNSFILPVLYLFSAVNGAGWALYSTISKPLIQEIVNKEELIHANSLSEISLQVGLFIASGVTGYLYVWLGFWSLVLVNGIFLMISILFINRIGCVRDLNVKTDSLFHQYAEGLNFLNKNRIFIIFGIVLFLPYAVTIAFNAVLPGYIKTNLHLNAEIFGIADMFYGIGALISGFMAVRMSKYITNNLTISLLFILSFSVLFILMCNSLMTIMFIGILFLGFTNSGLRIFLNTLAMERIPNKIFGSVTSSWYALGYIMQIAAIAIIGTTGDSIEIRFEFSLLGVMMIIGFLMYIVFIFPRFNNTTILYKEVK